MSTFHIMARSAAASGILLPDLSSYKDKPIDYIDPAPKPFEVQIPLVEYFERIKRLRADDWQKHFCQYLQDAVVNRHTKPTWAEFHAQAQMGKTVILSQAFKAWCFGHDPLWRATLAMYNITRSQAHSSVIRQIMQSQLHKDIFPNTAGHLPNIVSKDGWKTNARMDVNDGQNSFNPVGLQSGMTGSGFDWLTIDDPYKEPKDAFSETVFENLDRFWQYGVVPRLSSFSCIAAMFHRYSYDDFGGYLLNTGKFDYIRYASIADGDYEHEETGQKFPDPLDRADGDLISPVRFPMSYYDDKRVDTKVWMSMFQGRPSSKEGDFFHVNKIQIVRDAHQHDIEWNNCIVRGRGWDHAVTQGGGDKSAGGLVGIQPDDTVIVGDVFSDQLDSSSRVAKQKQIAEQDGRDVTVIIPEGLGDSGKDVVFFMQQELQGFNVVARKVANAAPGSDAKRRRAHNFSVAVNSGKVKFLEGEWCDRVLRLMRRFGASTSGDDEIDAISDAFNHLYEEKHKGNVVQGLSSLQTWAEYIAKYGVEVDATLKIPAHWTVYAALKISAEANAPNSGVIVARAPQNTGLKDNLFVLAEYKAYDSDYPALFTWLDTTLKTKCERPRTSIIHLHKDSEAFLPTIRTKLEYPVRLFNEAPTAGITEINWYGQNGALVGIVDDVDQLDVAKDSKGLVSVRQEALTWGFNDKGLPNGVGQVWDDIRMIAYAFRTVATDYSFEEKLEQRMPEPLRTETIAAMPQGVERDGTLLRRGIEERRVRQEMEAPVRRAGIMRRR